MEPTLWFSRAQLRRDASVAAIRDLLLPGDAAERFSAAHRLVWTLFADGPDRRRDFLWREAAPGTFYLLSARVPEDRHGLFEISSPKPFVLSLRRGDRLGFALRANATVARGGGPGRRGKPCDVVMDALHSIPPGERAAVRAEVVQRAGRAWLASQGERNGFRVPGPGEPGEDDVRVLAYQVHHLARGTAPMRIGVLDYEGILEITDPAAFTTAIARGFGRAKAFGCGLMLIRRV